MMKDKGFWMVFAIYTLLFLGDLGSTFIHGELAQYLEANPLYQYGGFFTLIALNLAFMVGFWWVYTHVDKPGWRFMVMTYMMFIIIARIYIIINNLEVAQDPPTLEQARQITVEHKTTWHFKMVIPLFMPIIPSLLTYYFWQKDHKIEKK